MALGVEMLLKSMGLDPDEIQKKYKETAAELQTTLVHFDQKLGAIQAKLDRIDEYLGFRLTLIEQKLDTLLPVAAEAKQAVNVKEETRRGNGQQHG